MSKKIFYILLLLISFCGVLLRFLDYDTIPPFGETNDEFMYPWAGISFLQTGVPSSWSWFPSYKQDQTVNYWGKNFRIVSPWLEKPPLYPLLTGTIALLSGQNQFRDVRLSTIRLVPIILSFFSIIAVGLLTQSLFSSQIGLIAATLYATIPSIIISNRLSLVENLLTPVVLFTIYLASRNHERRRAVIFPYLLGLGCGLALLTKNVGIALPISIIWFLAILKEWRSVAIVTIISLFFGLIHPLMGIIYNWSLYVNVLQDYRVAHGLGLPEFISTLFRLPVLTHKENIFLDGSMLAGYILLISSPFWLVKEEFENKFKYILVLSFPFITLVILALLEGGQTFFGWHLIPLYPFLTIILAKVIFDLWQKPEIFKSFFLFLVIGFSTVRFFLLLNPQIQKSWQLMLVVLLLILISSFFFKRGYQRLILLSLFVIFLVINIMVVINLDKIYPSIPQPADNYNL